MVEAQAVALESGEVRPLYDHAGEQFRVRLAQIAQQRQDADVLHHARNERLVAFFLPELGGKLASRDSAGERRPPIPSQLFGCHIGKQLVGQAESEHQQPQRFVAQYGERLIQVGHFPPQPKKRAVHHAKHFANERRILFEQLSEQPRIDLRLVGETHDFERDRRAAIERRGASGDLFNAREDFVHGRGDSMSRAGLLDRGRGGDGG